ncbi:MAG TPA: asparagine synthase (glutamine-hydrolyzing), partial [Vicinamibacterales bacterium]
MCGIAGIVGRDATVSQPALGRMQAALRHRGPDDEGQWRSPSNQASFAHTRLAVIAPGPAGHQPMASADGRFIITFSGEIYNYQELRQELERDRLVFRTPSDTEVVLHGYQSRGATFVSALRGMFAFAIWDEHERTCLLARDPFGLKPLYYHHASDGALLFASELRALLTAKVVACDLDPDGLNGYLRTGTVPEPVTLVKGVRALEAGHTLKWEDAHATTHCYWTPHFPDADPGSNHRDAVRATLLDSVRHHLVSDVPVGLFLSGGIDSAAILALANECGHRSVQTVSLTLPGSRDDEAALARQTAERFGARHAECAIDARAARELLPQYLPTLDQPSIDGFNTFVMSRFAREQGLKVVLSGVGADEMFGGYRSFAQV